MRFEMRQTQDGSLTVFDQEAGECYKSRHAAKAEAEAVFFAPGVKENSWFGKAQPFRVLELGFGLGTNFLYLSEQNTPLHLCSIERDLSGAEFFLQNENIPELQTIVAEKHYSSPPYSAELLHEDFFTALRRLATQEKFHAIFFDPFSPKANPEAWTKELFQLCWDVLEPQGRLVTYSVSRIAKDAASACGFTVQKRDLPPLLQKRSALLAIK